MKAFVFVLLYLIMIEKSHSAMACFSITDDLNLPNPILNANFNLLPDVGPFTDCWNATIKIRSSKNSWRLVASRTGPNPTNVSGNPSDNIMSSDIDLDFTLKSFGMAEPNDAILVSPFSTKTNLSSITSGTLIVSGIKRSGNSCSFSNPDYFKLTKNICLFRDFVFNTGEYNGEVTYLLVAP